MPAALNTLEPAQLEQRIDDARQRARDARRSKDYAAEERHLQTAAKLGRVLAEVRTRDLFAEPTPPPDVSPQEEAALCASVVPPDGVVTADEEDLLAKLERFPWAKGLRKLCLTFLLNHGPHTADEVAAALGKSPFAIRPRFSELETIGAVKWTGAKRNDIGAGKSQKVWEAL